MEPEHRIKSGHIAFLIVVTLILGIIAGVGLADSYAQKEHGAQEEAAHDAHSEEMSLSSLSGAQLDAEFLSQMIIHHQGAITMSEEVIARGEDPKVKELAHEIIAAQMPEIELMRSWLPSIPEASPVVR
jgi:uncharacterized protein (DUF305 family)